MTTPPTPPPGTPMQPPPAPDTPSPESTPPRGPGVVVPFAVPPRDTDKTRTILTIVISAVVAVLLCGGVAVGFGGVLVWYNNALTDETMDTASDFMDDLVADDYAGAYKQLCADTRKHMSESEFTSEWQPFDIAKYELETVTPGDNGDLVVPVDARTAKGSQTFDLAMKMNAETMGVEVCSW